MSRVGRDISSIHKSTPELVLEERLDHALRMLEFAIKHVSNHAEELIAGTLHPSGESRRGCDLHGVHVVLKQAHEQISRPLMDGGVMTEDGGGR